MSGPIDNQGATFQVPGLRDLAPIGRGASGAVFRAYDDELKRWVAVKVLLVDDPADPARKRFQREREITANLGKHPHIVQVLGTGFTSAGLPYVVMELFEQGSIADRLRTKGTYSVSDVIDIGIKIADAVEAAHRSGILHRDIKPQNILISEYGPALADFGIARTATNLEWSTSLEQLTPMHSAPEILLADQPSAEADVYALGSTLYTMLAGRPPFAGPSGESLLRYQVRVAQEPVPPFARSDVSEQLAAVIRRALAKDPADRFASAADFRDALRQIETATPSAFPNQSSPRTDVDEEASTISRERLAEINGETTTRPGSGSSAGNTDELDPKPVPSSPSAQVAASYGVLGDIQSPVDESPTTARPRVQQEPTENATQSKHRRRPLLIGTALLVIIGIALFALFGISGPNNAKPPPAATGTSASTSTSNAPQNDSSSFTLTGAPSDLSATLSGSGTIATLRWTDHTQSQAKYLIWKISTTGTVSPIPVPGTGTTTDVVNSLVPTASYCFVVNAIGGPTGTKFAPACICIRGGRLSGTPAGFPHITCAM